MNDIRSRFGFHTTPFTREFRVKQRFCHPQFNEAIEALLQTIHLRLSAAIIAPAGLGKTALIRALCDRLPDARYRIHYVRSSGLSKRDMCREITAALGLSPAGTTPALIRAIHTLVREAAETDGRRTLIIFDDAHELRPDVLALLKTLTNYSMDSQLLLSLLLVGQPPLANTLRRPNLEDVARRIAHYARLRLLTRDESRDYVAHRCAIAGCTTVPFDDGAMDAIFEIGSGNLRATDRLGLKALQVADARDVNVVDHMHVIEARRNLWP